MWNKLNGIFLLIYSELRAFRGGGLFKGRCFFDSMENNGYSLGMLHSLTIYFHGAVTCEVAQRKLDEVLQEVPEYDGPREVEGSGAHIHINFPQAMCGGSEARALGAIFKICEQFAFDPFLGRDRPEWVMLSRDSSIVHLIRNDL